MPVLPGSNNKTLLCIGILYSNTKSLKSRTEIRRVTPCNSISFCNAHDLFIHRISDVFQLVVYYHLFLLVAVMSPIHVCCHND